MVNHPPQALKPVFPPERGWAWILMDYCGYDDYIADKYYCVQIIYAGLMYIHVCTFANTVSKYLSYTFWGTRPSWSHDFMFFWLDLTAIMIWLAKFSNGNLSFVSYWMDSFNIILVKRFPTVRRQEITKTNLLITFSLWHLIPKLLGWILHYYSCVISFCFTSLAEVR